MPSKKNRRGKSNRRSPRALLVWLDAHGREAIVAGFAVLFGGAIVGGYWLAKTLEPAPKKPIYARIEDIPGLPQYTELEPGQKVATIEEKPQPKPAPQVAAATSASSEQQQTWRRNAVPFRDLASRPLIAIVIDDVGLDR